MDMDSLLERNIIMFIKGQQIVCVDDQFHPSLYQYFPSMPIKDRIYTVRDMAPGQDLELQEQLVVYLEEIIGSVNRHGLERGFNAERFVPLTELDTEEILERGNPVEVYEH